MASSSRKSCFQCEDSSSGQFRNGWRLRSGEFAQLCNRCSSLLEGGKFCQTYHSGDDGWRDCESCGKLIHCGCIVSFNAYLLLDFGGVICMDCSRLNFIRARSRCLCLESQIGNQEIQRDAMIEPQNWPRVTDSELQEISGRPKSAVTPLFEKILSATDTDLKLGYLVIPNKCAEAFFPVPDPHGFPIKIQDTDGKEWEFVFRCWLNFGREMYVLEGLREYMISNKWQVGDIVTFYRLEPSGKLIMGLRRSSSRLPPYKRNTRSM